jgi:hypothetical protein
MQTVSILDINGFHDTDNESASDEWQQKQWKWWVHFS